MQEVFEAVRFSNVEDDVNRVVFAGQKATLKEGLGDLADYSRILKTCAAKVMTKGQVDNLARDLAGVQLESLT